MIRFLSYLLLLIIIIFLSCTKKEQISYPEVAPCTEDTVGAIVSATSVARDEPQFSGWVVSYSEDGSIIPVTSAKFYHILYFDNSFSTNDLSNKPVLFPVDTKIHRDGYFLVKDAWASSAVLKECNSSLQLVTREISLSDVFVIKAPGYQDKYVAFNPEWLEKQIVLIRKD